jgi:hypothetical protein
MDVLIFVIIFGGKSLRRRIDFEYSVNNKRDWISYNVIDHQNARLFIY